MSVASLKELSRDIRNQSSFASAASRQMQLIPLLRTALNDVTLCPIRTRLSPEDISFQSRLIGELFGLVVSDVSVDNTCVLTLLSGLIRELCMTGEVPRFINEKLASYSADRLAYVLPLLRELRLPDAKHFASENIGFFSSMASNEDLALPIRLEAISTIIHFGKIGAVDPTHESLVEVDSAIADVLASTSPVAAVASPHGKKKQGVFKRALTSLSESVASVGPLNQSCLEIDGVPVAANDAFSVLLHMKSYSQPQLLHTALISMLHEYLEFRFGVFRPIRPLLAPPNTPDDSPMHQPATLWSQTSKCFDTKSSVLNDAVVASAIRVLSQCQRDVSPIISEGKKQFKFVETSGTGLASTSDSSAQTAASAGQTLGVYSPLVLWTREYVESVIVEAIKCLDVVCSRDPALVSVIFPHVRKVYERVIQRADSPGIAITEILKFFINHSYLVIFDIEPVLKFYFTTHFPRLVSCHSGGSISTLVMECVIFLLEFAPIFATLHAAVFVKHFPSILRLAAWFPRSAGTELVQLISHLVRVASTSSPEDSSEVLNELFHTLLDLPVITGLTESSLNVESYIDKSSHDNTGGQHASCPTVLELNPHLAAPPSAVPVEDDQFVSARIFMRLLRSSEFKDISEYVSRIEISTKSGGDLWTAPSMARSVALLTELWKGLPLTPRVAAASKLVPKYLEAFLGELIKTPPVQRQEIISKIFTSILKRFGSTKIFLFKSDISEICINFISRVISPGLLTDLHSHEVVTAVLERVVEGGTVQGDELVVHLVHLVGDLCTSAGLGLYVKMLRFMLQSSLNCWTHHLDPSHDIVYIEKGRVVKRPSNDHILLDQLIDSGATIRTSNELVCVVISALTKIASKHPQYRPQTVALFKAVSRTATSVTAERLRESTVILGSYHLSRELVCGATGG